MRALHSIRNRLAILVFAITFAAISVVYLYVVPRLEASLTDQRLAVLGLDTRKYASDLVDAIQSDRSQPVVVRVVKAAADNSGARVTLFGISSGTEGLQTNLTIDSVEQPGGAPLLFAIALRAAQTRRLVTATETGGDGRYGEAALPIVRRHHLARVVVFTVPLGDVQRTVSTIRKQVLVAGLIALVFALMAGWLVARALSMRIKRLETVARQVAAGDFSAHVDTDSDDELGQLARAFDEMQAQLAQLDSARKQFIATASHELRTPIFSLGGFIELLQDEELDEETRERFLDQLRQQVARLQKLALELLDLSKLEAGSLELRTEPVDLGELAREVAMEFTPALAQHDAHLELRLAQLPVELLCDPERVAQIIRILIDNAVTHTPTGTSVVVTATRANGTARVAVRDSGQGIRPTEMSNIFEPFYTSNDAHGSGLGLAIARELAERMEGRLDVASRPGQTTFTLELPA